MPGEEWWSAVALATAIRTRRVSATETIEAALQRIDREQPRLNAFITMMPDAARTAARTLDRRIAKRLPVGPLAGVPVAVKDLLLTRDAPTTAGSRIHGTGLRADRDAEVVRRLRRDGAIVVGKANLHEVALGVTTVNEHFGPARNPWDVTRASGGSSGGSAVAVAAGLCPLAVGTDTRGSIRIPAAACGITGFKPTGGLLSLAGVLPLAPSLDHVGPMAASVIDVSAMLGSMLGGPRGARLSRAHAASVARLTVGISDYHLRDLDRAVAAAIDDALRLLPKLVRRVVAVRIPELDGVQEASGIVASAEAVAEHDPHLRSRPEGYGPLVRQRLEGGYKHTALDYIRAMQKRSAVRTAFAVAFQEVHALVGATLPSLPPRIDEHHVTINGHHASTIDAMTRFNAPQNMAGIPALTVPAGPAEGIPTGLQIMGPIGGDATVLALGGAWQRATDHHLRRPGIPAARRRARP